MAEIGNRHHAVLHALLAKHTFAKYADAADRIRVFTEQYGLKRGRRMAANALSQGDPCDMTSFFIYGEWSPAGSCNESQMHYETDACISEVRVCAWFEAWKEYGLEEYGRLYCRYIDKAIAEGFAGSFRLTVKEAFGYGDNRCVFFWDSSCDTERLAGARKKNGQRYIRPFSFHSQELIDTYREAFPEDEDIIDQAKDSFSQLFGFSL